jgi:hypothetical protein
MLKSLRMKSALVVMALAIAAPALAQQTPAPHESPSAMRAPNSAAQGAPTLSAAEQSAQKGTPAQQELARKLADAMSSKDYAAMQQLIAPSTLKCIGKNQNFLQDRLRKQFALPISQKFELTVTKLPPNVMNPTQYVTFPMPPTHYMGFEFTDDDGETATVNLPIGQENGKWYEAQPCPTAAGMERFAQLQQTRGQAHERAEQALVQVKDPVRSQLVALIGKGETVSAWRLCMSAQHLNFPTCRGVVAILAGSETH